MPFNSIDFAIFLPIVFVLYWSVLAKVKHQNILIVLASFFFYGYWNWNFLALIIFSIIIDYIIGIKLSYENRLFHRKVLLSVSILANIGMLGFFKYYNFFIGAFTDAFTFFGYQINDNTLDIILPVGISFYTFQTMSYTIDVYRRKVKCTRDFIAFAAFVSFFPQLVAGPIEKASNLLPQIIKKRVFNLHEANDGLRQILWGLFKKVVIADGCGELVSDVYNNTQNFHGSTLFLAVILFNFQLYGDFSGYSDIAIGTARLFGIKLQQNFAFPYFSRNMAEFYRRWHISLSSWFKEYLYIPLGGSRGSTWQKVRNIFIIFIISGFWHGANWTFIIWGFINAVYFLPLILTNKNRSYTNVVAENRYFPNLIECYQMILVFFLTGLSRVFFRSENINQAFSIINKIFSKSLFTIPNIDFQAKELVFFCLIIAFILVEWLSRRQQYALENFPIIMPKTLRWACYFFIIIIILQFNGDEQQFIYFQF
ncbi:MBOAT family O-acyltransferase [Saccharicrinis aurantiacus]|uniref:MBOAT family O-acyltransferase n=1 Tax=Saccharicrinis aurantiacus TaxID=1849719 RepID=UPI000839023E|nr:MBOAT family O-acyltransferase [Saccharicrinis aurantiacus]